MSLMDYTETNILQYEAQLAQVQLASASLPEGPEKEKLDALEADLKELISLSRSNGEENESDPLLEEYNIFKAEMQELDVNKDEKLQNFKPQSSKTIESEGYDLKEALKSLKGTKCQAPFTYKWSNNVTYSNAFITHVPQPDEVKEYGQINVKVMFTNPTHKNMLPCPYYLEGECKFSDYKCRYSHGELVLFSSLKEYREPDFSKVCRGCKVLAKQSDELWYRASIIDVDETDCRVKFESNSKEEVVSLCDIFPLDTNDCCSGNTSSDEDDVSACVQKEVNDDLVRRILCTPPGSVLGEWEKFTKGFGSKIMAKMGYIHGSGLGKNGMGRVEPVPAVILPAGKSLDHCMMLREKAGNDKDLCKAERKLKFLQKKHEERLKKAYEAEKEKTDIFTFLNSTLHPSKIKDIQKVKIKNEFKNETNRNLNVTGLQIAEELKKVKKEIKALNQSLTRLSPYTHGFNVIKEKIAFKENKLSQLHASEKRLKIEQDRRKDRQKLSEF